MTDETAIVTGAASGIGRALARGLGARGADVVLADRQIGLAEEAAAEVRELGGRAVACELDVRHAAQFDRLVTDTVSRTGRIDYLFNNAGIGVAGEMVDYEPQDWGDVLDVNLRGVAHGISAVYPLMKAQGSGHIVNTASMAGLVPAPYAGSYCASKYAVVGLSRSLRVEAQSYGVKVSVLCPGAVRTPIFTGGRFGRLHLDEAANPRILELAERLRPMDPDEFAKRALRAVARNQAIIIFPRWWHLLWWMERWSPSCSQWLARRMFEQRKQALLPFEQRARPCKPSAP